MGKDRGKGSDDNPDDRRRWEAIHRFLDGLSPLPERREVERWIADDLAVRRYIKAHRKVWSMIFRRMGPKPVDPEEAWEGVVDSIAEHERTERSKLPGRGREHLRVVDGDLGAPATAARRTKRRAIAVGLGAAAVLIGVTSFVTLRHSSVQIAAEISRASHAATGYSVQRGAPPRELQLPDGIEVTLAPDSRIEYEVGPTGAHIASLIGEALFAVDHRPNRVFIVRAPGVETRDLGTEFDVRAYPHSRPRIAVLAGRVSVRTSRSASTVDAGLIATVDSAGTASLGAISSSYFEWTIGRLVFSHEQLGDVVADVGRKYDLDFDIPDATLSALTVTITVFKDTPRQFLEQLTKTIPGLGYEQHGRTVHLFRR
jgi:ferric-dicitrate binding protein FerR (iron transport regulator)